MIPTPPAFAVICCLTAAAGPLVAQRDGARFRAGLTATVAGDAAANGCRQITLRWTGREGATSYQVHVGRARDGAWITLPAAPAASPCGAPHALSPMALIDAEPAAATTGRRLFYRVVAFGPAGPIDSTDVVPVELLAAVPVRPGRP